MSLSLRKKKKPTEGERARVVAFSLVGLNSACLGYLAVLHLDRGALFDDLSWYQTWIVVASALGGLMALFLSGDRMGQSGTKGALRGLAGAIWVTFIGSLIGGTLSLPLYGTMFGPFIVCVTLIGAPILMGLWCVNMFSIHLLMAVYQRERDSIFTPSRMTRADHPESLSLRLRGRFS